VRFVLDHDVDAEVGRLLRRERHDCWTASDAGLARAQDNDLAVYTHSMGAALLTHDQEFTARQRERSFMQHVWLHCIEPAALEVVGRHLDALLSILTGREAVVVELTVTRCRALPPLYA